MIPEQAFLFFPAGTTLIIKEIKLNKVKLKNNGEKYFKMRAPMTNLKIKVLTLCKKN